MKSVGIVISTVGYHWEEVYDAYLEFNRANWHIELYTAEGKNPVADPRSLEVREFLSLFGLGLSKSFAPDTKVGMELLRHMQFVKPISELDMGLDALYIPGGHGCLFDVNLNDDLHEKIKEFYFEGKPLSAVCHGTSAFAFVEAGGKSIIDNKKVTGFPELLDDILVKVGWVDESFLPIPYSNEKAMKDAGGIVSPFNFLLSLVYPTYHIVDFPFVTGIGPKAAQNVARKVITLSEETDLIINKGKRAKRRILESV